MSGRPSPAAGQGSSKARTQRLIAITVLSSLIAASAPLSLTGAPVVDAFERALLVGVVTFVGAHAHRWAWIVAGALVVVPARDASLVLGFVGLAGAAGSTVLPRRPRDLGGLIVGVLANAVLWYPPGTPQPLGRLGATGAALLVLTSGWPSLQAPHRRAVGILSAVTACLMVVATALGAWAALSARQDVEAGSSAARAALRSVRGGDSDAAEQRLANARVHLAAASERLDGSSTALAAFVPVVAQQVEAASVAVDQGLAIAKSADDLVRAADYDQLRYQGDVDLQAVTALQEPARHVDLTLRRAQEELDGAASPWLVGPLRTRIDDLRADVEQTGESARLASDLLDVSPGLLGGSGARTYLVAFMTPAELRGAGGFIGAYAELRAVDGHVDLVRSGRIDDLLEAAPRGTRTLTGPADYVRRYGRNDLADYLQDLTISPDFPADASAFAELYPQSGGRPVDGVIGVDPAGLAALLRLTGPVEDPELPERLTADNVEDQLLRRQYLAYGDRAARGEILAAATRATFEALTDASLPAPRTLGHALGPVVDARHLYLWSRHPTEQQAFERLGADGALALTPGADAFSVIQQNSGNNKIDAYLHRTIRYRAKVDPSEGTVQGTLTIRLENQVPSTDLPNTVVANTRAEPRGSNVSTLTIATPHQLVSATVDGKAVQLGPDTEAGLNMYDSGKIVVPPGGTVTVVVELRGRIDLRGGYHLQVLPQATANPDVLDVAVTARGARFAGDDTRGGRVRSLGLLEDTADLEATIVR